MLNIFQTGQITSENDADVEQQSKVLWEFIKTKKY